KPAGSSELGSLVNAHPSEVAVVGDRVLTDIVFGNLAGCTTILVRDLVTTEGDNWAAAQVRWMERKVLSLLIRAGVEPPQVSKKQ
ncbi:hypothetical protein HK405_000650, partial [Cladochytrium tenue]